MISQVFVRSFEPNHSPDAARANAPGRSRRPLIDSGQRYIIYPAYAPAGSRKHVDKPDQHKMPIYEDLTLESSDKLKIKAYLILQGAGLAGKAGEEEAKKRPTVLFLHANAGNMVGLRVSPGNTHYFPEHRYDVCYRDTGYHSLTYSMRNSSAMCLCSPIEGKLTTLSSAR